MEDEQKQHLLFAEETSNDHRDISPAHKSLQLLRPKNPFIFILLFLSFGINAFFFSSYFVRQNRYSTHNLGLMQDIQPMQRWRYTAYSHPNETYRNEAWDSIDIDRTIVAVDHEEAVALGLPPTAVFPWDNEKDLYALSAYHQFHCLKLLYKSLQEAHHGKPFSNGYTHILHCLDALRGDFKCLADDHLFSVGTGWNPPIGEGQFMQCRDFSKLDEWARDHHSCFKYNYINDDLPPTEMHQWRNCPKDSKYASKVREYFGYDENWVPEFTMNHGPEFPDGNEDRVDGW